MIKKKRENVGNVRSPSRTLFFLVGQAAKMVVKCLLGENAIDSQDSVSDDYEVRVVATAAQSLEHGGKEEDEGGNSNGGDGEGKGRAVCGGDAGEKGRREKIERARRGDGAGARCFGVEQMDRASYDGGEGDGRRRQRDWLGATGEQARASG